MKTSKIEVLIFACALAGGAFAGPQTGATTMGMPFRRMMISQYGKEMTIDSDTVRAYHVIDVDVPAGGREAEQISGFIGQMLASPTNASVKACDFGFAVGHRRKAFFARCERLAFAGFAFMEGRLDLSDERYLGYSVRENSWTGSKTGGEYVTALGVYSRALGRRMTLSDFFAPEKLLALNALIQQAYAERGPRGNLGTFEDFRRRYPRDPGGMTVDPVATESFTMTPHGFKWAYFDRDIVGYLSAAKEFPIEVEVPWSKIEPLLKDPSLMPKVRF